MRRFCVLAALLLAPAGPGLAVAQSLGPPRAGTVRVDTWESEGPLDLSREWQLDPNAPAPTFKYPPAVVVDGGQRVLRLKTDHESVSIWRAVRVDLRDTPRLTWDWKALTLPDGGDVRQPKRNDQAARVMVLFEGWKSLLYIWDSQAPVGREIRPDVFATVDRALVVVRSGPAALGRWHRERRDVRADYRRIFEEEPRAVKWIGLESHSDDVQSQSEALFGSIRFER